jgi:uncharacterized protein YjbI with pentapeptide repeats
MKIEIKHRFSGAVLYACDVPDTVARSGMEMRHSLEKANKDGSDLSYSDLSGSDLSYSNLSGSNLSYSNLSGSNLSYSNLSGSDLSGSDLSYSNLSDSNLSGSNLSGSDLSYSNLSGSDLSYSNLSDSDLSYSDLSYSNLSGSNLSGSNLSYSNLSGSDLSGSNLSGSDGNQLPRATLEQAIENLDKVRAIVLDNETRLDMGHWHGDDGWRERTCAEETLCGTTHCMAGWLQVCTTEQSLKDIPASLAGILAAPVAAKMFYRGNAEALEWLRDRKYVAETEEYEKRAAELKAKRESEKSGAA